MASPPYQPPAGYSSSFPPHPSAPQLTLKRPNEMPSSASKRRKHSVMSATSLTSAHPLRQTSFPPDGNDNRAYSPQYSARSPSMDAASLVSGANTAGKTGKKRGRKPKNAAGAGTGTSTVQDDGASLIGKGSVATSLISGKGGQGQGQTQEDEDDDDDAPVDMNFQLTGNSMEQEQLQKYHRAVLVEAMAPDQLVRYESYRQFKFSDNVVRRLVNQTLSQSVPSNVVIAVRSVTKVFAGEIIELARRIQTEELHASVDDPAPNHDLQPRHQNTIPIPTTFIPRGPLDPPPSYPNSQYNSAPGTSANTPAGGGGGGGGEEMDGEGFTKEGKKREYNDADWEQLNENRMQPLRPPVSADHLREAVRRYRVEREGGLVGFMGLERTQHSTGAERFGNKFGGRRMMR